MILITGATGTVGTQVVKQLAATGTRFKVLARVPRHVPFHPNVEVVQGDLADTDRMEELLAGVDRLFLLSPSIPGSTGMQNRVIAAARNAGVGYVVRMSVLGADDRSPIGLAQWHAASDACLRSSGVRWTILRPSAFMQNVLSQADVIRRDGALYGAAGDGRLAMVDARDVASVIVTALCSSGHEGRTYLLTGREAIPFTEVARQLTRALGKTVKYVDVTPQQYKAALVNAGKPEWLADDYATMSAIQKAGGSSSVDATLGKIIGRVRTFDQFLEDYLHAFMITQAPQREIQASL